MRNNRWSGVPFTLRSGKALGTPRKQIVAYFRQVPHLPVGFDNTAAPDKLIINLNNAVNALSGRTLVEQLRERDYRRVVAASQREGLRLLDQAGIRPAKVGAVGPKLLPHVIGAPDWLFRSLFMKAWKIDERARSSMADANVRCVTAGGDAAPAARSVPARPRKCRSIRLRMGLFHASH